MPVETAEAEAIVASLDLAAEAGGDLTDRVYRELFARHPEMEALFVRDTTGAVKGEMLARVFEMVLDYVGRGAYAENMVRSEVITHAGYDVPPTIFPLFFDVVAACLKEAASEAWTDDMSRAWASMLADFRRFAAYG
jgi:hemoglobin-like flavoprotein